MVVLLLVCLVPRSLASRVLVLGTQVLLLVLSFCCLFVPLTEYFSPFSDGAVVGLFESDVDEDDDAALVMRR